MCLLTWTLITYTKFTLFLGFCQTSSHTWSQLLAPSYYFKMFKTHLPFHIIKLKWLPAFIISFRSSFSWMLLKLSLVGKSGAHRSIVHHSYHACTFQYTSNNESHHKASYFLQIKHTIYLCVQENPCNIKMNIYLCFLYR